MSKYIVRIENAKQKSACALKYRPNTDVSNFHKDFVGYMLSWSYSVLLIYQ